MARGVCAVDSYEECPTHELLEGLVKQRAALNAVIRVVRRLHEAYPEKVGGVHEGIASIIAGGMCLFTGDYAAAWDYCIKGQQVAYSSSNLEGIVRSTHYLVRIDFCQDNPELADNILRANGPWLEKCEDLWLKRKIEADREDVNILLGRSL